MPPLNSHYKTKEGQGRVIGYDVFKETVTLKFDSNKYEALSLDQLKNYEYTPPVDSDGESASDNDLENGDKAK